MNISTKSKYSLQLLTYLGFCADAEHLITLKEVALSEGLSEKYLWQVANQLKGAGFIKAVPGPRGGFVLAKLPSAITLADALGVFEPELFRAPLSQEPALRTHAGAAVRDKLQEVDKTMEQLLEAATIADLVEECRRRQKDVSSYQI